MFPCPRLIRLYCAAALSGPVLVMAQAQQETDPFLAGAHAILQMIPVEGLTREARVDVEWIALPHAAAATLLHTAKTPADAAGLRERLLPMLESGHAVRVDLSSIVVRNGQRAATPFAVESPHPAGHSRSRTSRRLWLDGRTAPGESVPSIPTDFWRAELGRTFDAEINISDEGVPSLLLSHLWRTLRGAENRGADRRRWAVLDESGGTALLELPPGQWRMVSLSSVASLPNVPALQADAAVFVFARVGTQGAPEPAEAAALAPGLLHVEWIEAEKALLDQLGAAPGMEGAGQLRAALDHALEAGQALRAGSAAAVFSTRPNDVSISAASGKVHSHAASSDERGVRGDARSGSRFEAKLSWSEERKQLEISGEAELSSVDGFDEHAERIETPRLSVRRSPLELSLPAGQTVLISVLDALPQPGGSTNAPRRLLVFLRALY